MRPRTLVQAPQCEMGREVSRSACSTRLPALHVCGENGAPEFSCRKGGRSSVSDDTPELARALAAG